MAAVQDVPRVVLQAILASQSPLAPQQQRKEAVAFLEQVRQLQDPFRAGPQKGDHRP